MAFGVFQNENLANKVRGDAFDVGINNADNGADIEDGGVIPWTVNPAFSWLDYRCWIEVFLDAGMVLHKPLPQSAMAIDDLGVVDVASPAAMEKFSGSGVNLESSGGWSDAVQRMATSEYIFTLKGFALRVGYQIPVPKLVTVAGVPAIPGEFQWTSGNVLVDNLSGIPLWYCAWEKEYFVILPPKQAQTPPANLSAHIRGDVKLPQGMQAPYSQPDSNAVAALPPQVKTPQTKPSNLTPNK